MKLEVTLRATRHAACLEFANSIYEELYQQPDKEQKRVFMVSQIVHMLEPLTHSAEQAGLTLRKAGLKVNDNQGIVPHDIASAARSIYRELHDRFQKQTDDRHYLQNVRAIGGRLDQMCRQIARVAAGQS